MHFYFVGEQSFAVVKGRGVGPADAKAQALLAFGRIKAELEGVGASLEDLVRTSIFTVDQESRPGVSEARREIYPLAARPTSSSLIDHHLLDTLVEVEATAMLRRGRAISLQPVEFDPPRPYLKGLLAGGFVFLSGTGGPGNRIEEQTRSALDSIAARLQELGSDWSKLFRLDFYVRRTESVEVVHSLAAQRAANNVTLEFTLCDEFARPDMLIEIEGAALRQF